MSTSTKTVKELDAEAKGLLKSAKAVLDNPSEHTPEQIQGAMKSLEDAEAIAKQLEGLSGGEALKTLNRLENTLSIMEQPDRPNMGGGDGVAIGHDGRPFLIGRHEVKSAGEMFVSDETWNAWLKQMAPKGYFPRTAFSSPAVALKTLIYTGGTTSGGPLTWPDQRRDLIVPAPFRPFTVLSVITRLETSSDTVEYVRITGYTNNAAPVAEATASGGASGLKPESALATAAVSDAVKTIAHNVPATTRVIQDAPQLRGIIDQFLRDGLIEELEDQIINGDGTGENFTGILNTAGTTSQAWDTDILTTTRKARTKVRTVGRATPNAYLLHPTDWETLDLTQDAEDRYYFGGPSILGQPKLWGLPVVETEAMPAGTGTVGDHKQAVLWDRMQTMVTTGTINDDFTRNIVRILAEMRAGFGVLRPAAIVEIDLTA